MNLTLFHRNVPTRARKATSTRRTFQLEGLEERTVMSAAAVAHVAPMPAAHVAAATPAVTVAPNASAFKLLGVTVNNVTTAGKQLVANATVSFSLNNGANGTQTYNVPVAIPISLTSTPVPHAGSGGIKSDATTAAAPAVSVLHLTLGPVNLSLLGLNVHLGESCAFNSKTPITANIVAIPTGSTYTSPINGMTYTGGALGDLLSGVANLLNGSGGVSGLGSTLSGLESGLTQIVNGLLAPASGVTGGTVGGVAGTPAASAAAAGKTSEVLELPLGPVSLDLLGALVQTSHICLNVTATTGNGNLLGNLLG